MLAARVTSLCLGLVVMVAFRLIRTASPSAPVVNRIQTLVLVGSTAPVGPSFVQESQWFEFR